MPAWKRIQDQETGLLYHLSESLAIIDWRYPGLLEPVADGVMIIASDYSGQHKRASNEAYSFLITTDQALHRWLPALEEFRTRWLPDGRRISFKHLKEPLRWRALLPFLNAAETLSGNVLTFLIDRRVGSFIAGGAEGLRDAFPDCFSPTTKPGTMEKMLRLASFVAMLTAGFRKEDQRSLWVSDHDETLATFERREQFARLAYYLTFGCTRWKNPADLEFCTTESPYAPTWVEDLAAIPDLIAGASCHLSHLLPTNVGSERWTRVVSSATVEDRRVHVIGDWMAATSGPLRQILLRLDLDDGGVPRASAQFFAGAHCARNHAYCSSLGNFRWRWSPYTSLRFSK